MTSLIHVPRPSKESNNPNRPVSSLLRKQIEHLHIAERRLPPEFHSTIYVNAIKTEGEAAAYIRHVTEAIHKAHEDAASRRANPELKGKPETDVAPIVGAAERPARRRSSVAKGNEPTQKSGQKK